MSNLSEEEKKAIEGIRKDIEEARTIERVVGKESVKNIRQYEIALNLIDRLQKELEQEKEKSSYWEQRVTDKIKELEFERIQTKTIQPSKQSYNYAIEVLEELLKEN